MQQQPQKIDLRRRPRFFPLQYRLILLSSSLVMLLLLTISLAVGYQQSRTITNQVERRGLAIAQSLAASSRSALTTYNYITLSQTANQAGQDPDIAYVIIHDKEGRVAGHSKRRDLEWQFLKDDISQRALSSKEPLIQNAVLEGTRTPILEITIPVSIPGSEKAWGYVRVALSLDPMHRQIRQVQLIIGAIGLVGLVLAVLACIWLARRITNPIGLLVQATVVAAKGNLDQDIRITTGDEVEVLAENFSTMIHEILLQRRQLEQQLVEISALEAYLNNLLTTMSDGLLSVDMEGNLVTLNPAAGNMLRRQAAALECAKNIDSVLKEIPELLEYIRNALSDPYSAKQQELRFVSNQEVKNIIVAPSILTNKGNAPQQVILNLHDVTELKKLESRYRQSERLAALGTLSAGMAHEIRNPLSAIKTFVQLLPRKMEKPGFLEKFQRTVPRELERINRLVEDLLELARAPKYQFTLVDIQQVLLQVIELFEEELLSHRVDYRLEIPEQLPMIWANSDQLTKAFNNIIRNAIQAMPDGGDLYIHSFVGPLPYPAAETPGEDSRAAGDCWVRLVFDDTGMGIEPEDLKSLFNPFFTTKDSGTGLGMAITHKVITEHGGQIEVESTPGKGSRFIIYLPAKEDSKPGKLPAYTTP